jgi:hypothetical protein
VVRKLLAKDTDRRYPSAHAVSKALSRIGAGRPAIVDTNDPRNPLFMRGMHHVPTNDRRAQLQ